MLDMLSARAAAQRHLQCQTASSSEDSTSDDRSSGIDANPDDSSCASSLATEALAYCADEDSVEDDDCGA